MKFAHGFAAPLKCSGCGWPSTPAQSFCPCSRLRPRTQHVAHSLIHSLRRLLAHDCLPLFTSDGLNLYFYALTAHFGQWLQVDRRGHKVRKSAGGSGSHLRSGKKKLPKAQAGSDHARDALGGTSRSHGRLAGIGLLGSAEHRFFRTGESDDPAWRLSSRKTYLGHRTASSTPFCPLRMVARLLPLCASSRITSRGARAATRARWQTASATLSAAYPSHGSRKNQPTMDGARGALLPLAASFRLRGIEARCECSVMLRGE
jgi:hypothetical protein